jgi:hypothetical protein
MTESGVAFLQSVAAEIEAHVAQAGWEQRPALFALVRAAQLAADDPQAAARLGLDEVAGAGPAGDSAAPVGGPRLIPIEQDELPEGPLDEVLAQICWPATVAGCALSQQIMFVPPPAAATDQILGAAVPAAHRRQPRAARLVVAALRSGHSAAVLRLRATAGTRDDLLTGPDLAPNLSLALLATLQD